MTTKAKTITKKVESKVVAKSAPTETKKKSFKPRIKKNTQITDTLTYNVKENMLFEDVYEGEVPGGKIPIKFYKFGIYTKNEDGTVGDLVLSFSELMCFGISMGTDPKTGDPTGYSMALALMGKENPTDEEKLRITKLEEIIEFAKEFLLENKKVVKMPKMDAGDLKKFSPIYYKKDEEGNRVEGSPSLYPKLLEKKAKTIKKKNKETGLEEEIEEEAKILTVFYNVDDLDENGDPIEMDASLIVDKFCKATPLLKVEGIFVGQNIKLQVKVYESDIKLLEVKSKRLLHNKEKKDDKGKKLLEKKDEQENEENPLNDEKENEELSLEDEKPKKTELKKKKKDEENVLEEKKESSPKKEDKKKKSPKKDSVGKKEDKKTPKKDETVKPKKEKKPKKEEPEDDLLSMTD